MSSCRSLAHRYDAFCLASCWEKALSVVLFLAIAIAIPVTVEAQQIARWINPAGGFFDVVENWEDDHVPNENETAYFDYPLFGFYTVYFDETTGSRTNEYMQVLNNSSVILASQGSANGNEVQKYTITKNVVVQPSSFLGIGGDDDSLDLDVNRKLSVWGSVYVNSGSRVNVGSTTGIGWSSGRQQLFVQGGSEFVAETLVAGHETYANSTGKFFVITDAKAETNDEVILGLNGSSGEVLVESGGLWTANGNKFYIGKQGEGNVTIEDQGRIVAKTGIFRAGPDATSSLTVGDAGSEWLSDWLIFNDTSLIYAVNSGMITCVNDCTIEEAEVDFVARDGGTIRIGGQTLVDESSVLNVKSYSSNLPANLIFDYGIFNQGTVAIFFDCTIDGPFENFGVLQILLDAEAIFAGDVANQNGINLNASCIFRSGYSGSGDFYGEGDAYFYGTVDPGTASQPSTIYSEGNIHLEPDANLNVRLAGTEPSMHSGLTVNGLVAISDESTLSITLEDGFSLEENMEFVIVQVDGNRTGEFAGLSEGSVVDTLGGFNVRITYTGGDGDDVALLTEKRICTHSFTFDSGIMTLIGTDSDDTISVHVTSEGAEFIVNDCIDVLKDVTQVVVEGRSGNDHITIEFPGATVFGGTGDDTITINGTGRSTVYGNDGNDTIVGGRGQDDIDGGIGNDNIEGRSGNDTIDGGPGSNTLRGGPGSDTIFGGSGVDDIIGGEGHDTIHGNAGDDTITGGAGNDDIQGGGGSDFIIGGSGFDNLKGGPGSDRINGGVGRDQISGGNGDDILSGNGNSDIVEGNAGDDTLSGGPGNDEIHGGQGYDSAIDSGEAGESGIESN